MIFLSSANYFVSWTTRKRDSTSRHHFGQPVILSGSEPQQSYLLRHEVRPILLGMPTNVIIDTYLKFIQNSIEMQNLPTIMNEGVRLVSCFAITLRNKTECGG